MKFELTFPNGTIVPFNKFSQVIQKLEEVKTENDEVHLTLTMYMEVLIDSKTKEPLQTNTLGKPAGLIKYLTEIRSVLARACESGREFRKNIKSCIV